MLIEYLVPDNIGLEHVGFEEVVCAAILYDWYVIKRPEAIVPFRMKAEHLISQVLHSHRHLALKPYLMKHFGN